MNLTRIQQELKAPKGQRNTFGNYNYRSCEDIVEAVKPLLQGAVLTLSDQIVEVGGRIYVKATARLVDGETTHEVTAFAREPEQKKGMDESQITGAASSYARKYALNGLFLIDDTRDADTMDNREQPPTDLCKKAQQLIVANPKVMANPDVAAWVGAAMEDGCFADVVNYFQKGLNK